MRAIFCGTPSPNPSPCDAGSTTSGSVVNKPPESLPRAAKRPLRIVVKFINNAPVADPTGRYYVPSPFEALAKDGKVGEQELALWRGIERDFNVQLRPGSRLSIDSLRRLNAVTDSTGGEPIGIAQQAARVAQHREGQSDLDPKQIAERARPKSYGRRAPANLFAFFVIQIEAATDRKSLIARIHQSTENPVEAVYVDRAVELPAPLGSIDPMQNPSTLHGAESVLQAAPQGIGTVGLTARPVDFSGLAFADLEPGWCVAESTPGVWSLQHDDLGAATVLNTSGPTGVRPAAPNDGHPASREAARHGTKVLGTVMAKANNSGIAGVVPDTPISVRLYSTNEAYVSDVVLAAIDLLNPNRLKSGDILLIEEQTIDSQGRYAPIEQKWFEFDAIAKASHLGVIVIEPASTAHASSKGTDLDAVLIEDEGVNGPVTVGMLRRGLADSMDSGAVVVAAASKAVPHQGLSFGGSGSRVDCYAWGEGVATTLTDPAPAGMALPSAYTTDFGGTSAAGAIIAGAALATQGMYQHKWGAGNLLGPRILRALLGIGTPGLPDPNRDAGASGHIGNMPDLIAIAAAIDLDFDNAGGVIANAAFKPGD